MSTRSETSRYGSTHSKYFFVRIFRCNIFKNRDQGPIHSHPPGGACVDHQRRMLIKQCIYLSARIHQFKYRRLIQRDGLRITAFWEPKTKLNRINKVKKLIKYLNIFVRCAVVSTWLRFKPAFLTTWYQAVLIFTFTWNVYKWKLSFIRVICLNY